MNVGKQDGTCATAVRGRKWRSLAFFGFFLFIQSKIEVFHSMLLIVVTNKRIISEPTDMLACQEIYCVKLRKHTLVLEILANILLTWNPPRQLCMEYCSGIRCKESNSNVRLAWLVARKFLLILCGGR
jgi:hypothetical protein